MKKALLVAVFGVLVWLVILELGGRIIETTQCGGVGRCGDDIGVGLIMVAFAALSACAVAVVVVLIVAFAKKSEKNGKK